MIRSELIQKIADENPHLYQRDVERIVNTVFEEVTDAMARGDRVELRGFGAFSVKQRDARVGRNPRTGRSSRPAARASQSRCDKGIKRAVTVNDAHCTYRRSSLAAARCHTCSSIRL